ncbi:MAG TPA: hypothetical protein VJ203_01605 [Bacteroidales bacterium]|nr:hypothetical protein [Bacteroidales bacterium]
MILLSDSGSTKTEWCLVNENTGTLETCQTSGINPYYQDGQTIYRILQKEFSLVLQAPVSIYFYGAGCGSDKARGIVRSALKDYFNASSLVIESDLMAAARSLCQRKAGIACIMGTGSNSCYFNGEAIVQHVPALGYILGDEGSGADIGRRLIADILKKQLPPAVSDIFFKTYSYTPDQIQEHVYKNPFPNRFLAQFTTFIADNIQEYSLRNLVKTSFNKFFIRNIRQYHHARELPINFTGSIAWYFGEILQESADDNGFHVGTITRSPMQGLIKFHTVPAFNA